MSLFQSFGQGDFWGKGFAFASPVNDLLDRGDYTLIEIFDEDDLLQEIKSMNTRLIDYLSQEATLEEMVTFLVEPAEEGADDKRIHKFPYMACEVICCEVDHMIDNLVAMKDGEMIHRIFSLLDTEGDLDDRLSGYFEKVVFVLLKRKCLQLMKYINEGGLELFGKFVRHLDNYSIMQLVERLFLHQPGWEGAYNTGPVGLDLGGGDEDASGSGSGIDLALLRCNWSTMPEVVDILVDQLVEQGEEGIDGKVAAIHTHVAELLLTVIENASPDCVFIKNLTDKISRLSDLAIPALDLSKDSKILQEEALAIVKEERTSMLSALTIVEALLSRPQAIKMHWDMGQQQSAEGLMEGGEGISPGMDSMMEGLGTLNDDVTDKLIASLPLLRVYLTTHEVDDRKVNTQIKEPAPKLGLTRLKLVRHVEALVKLCNARVDRPLEKEGVLKVCLDMFFKYEWTSVLHQSITRIVTWIMDAGPSRLDLQVYLVKECNVLQRLLAANEYNDEQEEGTGGKPRCRRGYMGHLFIMAQAIMEAARSPMPDDPMAPEIEEGKRSFTQVMETELDQELVNRWTDFIQGRLAQITATQCHPLGGYPIPSRADENKLSTKFEEQSPDFEQMSEMLAQRLSGVDVGKPGEEGEGGDSVVWRETVSMQLSNEEVNLALGPGGAMAFRVGHGDGFDTDEVVFTLDGEEKDRISSPTGAWDGQTFGEGSGAGGGSANASGGTFGTFGPLDDNAAGAAGGGAGWADFTNFETAFSSAGGVGGGGATNPSSSPSSSSGGFVGTASVGVKKEGGEGGDGIDFGFASGFSGSNGTSSHPTEGTKQEGKAAVAQEQPSQQDDFLSSSTFTEQGSGEQGGGGGENGGATTVKREPITDYFPEPSSTSTPVAVTEEGSNDATGESETAPVVDGGKSSTNEASSTGDGNNNESTPSASSTTEPQDEATG